MSTLKINTLSNVAGSQSISTDRVAQGTAAAWVNFNGTGTVAIRAGGNVSSITDNGSGDYTINFTNAMPDTSYAKVLGGSNDVNGARVASVTTVAAGSVRILYSTLPGANVDPTTANAAVFR